MSSKAISYFKLREHTDWNYHYFPILFTSEETLLKAQKKMNAHNIHPRRYFYPSLHNLPYIDEEFDCPVSEDISKRILCLPLYVGLTSEEQELITSLIHE